MVDPDTTDLYVVTKVGFKRPNTLFRLAAPHKPVTPRELEPLGPVFAGEGTDIAITGADISEDGTHIALRSLRAVNYWSRAPGVSIADTILGSLPCAAPVPSEPKGEAIGFADDGYFTLSEGAAQPLYFVRFAPAP